MLPSVGDMLLRIMRASVDLPLPDLPMIVKISGRRAVRVKLTSLTASTRRRDSSPPVQKLRLTPRTSRSCRADAAHCTVPSVTAWQATRCPPPSDCMGGTTMPADIHRDRAARMEAAARRRIGKVGRRAFQPLARFGVADPGQAADQVDGVGMARIAEDIAGAALLDQPPGIHDAQPVGQVGVDRHVVGDEQDRGPHLPLHFPDHRQHALLDDDVERRGRLVRDDEARPADGRQAITTRWRMPPDSSCG